MKIMYTWWYVCKFSLSKYTKSYTTLHKDKGEGKVDFFFSKNPKKRCTCMMTFYHAIFNKGPNRKKYADYCAVLNKHRPYMIKNKGVNKVCTASF